jgi:hypothetical protein
MKYTKKIQITEPAMVDLGARNPLSMVHGLAFGMGCNWRFWSVAMCHSLHALVSVYIFKKGRWKLVKV